MDRAELTLAVAGALVAAVLLGWTLAWIAGRLNGRPAQTSALADRLEAAEAARRQAEARLGAVEADLGARLGEAEADIAKLLAQLDRERAANDEIRAAYRAAVAEREA